MDERDAPRSRYVGTHIVRIIDLQGLRQVWVAEQMGYHRTYFARVLNGSKPITDEFVRRACAFFRMPPEALFVPAEHPPDD